MVVRGRLTESISRLIDGDLDPNEAEELQEILDADRMLQRELEGLTRVRSSLRSLADRERPPARLDALVDPLLRGRPTPMFARPWARWLAAAAVVILGVTAIFEVQHHQSGPSLKGWQERVLEGTAAVPTERYALAPLPTSSVPDEDRPVGAADRLVSGPEPDIEPVIDPAPALEVMGPLEAGTPNEELIDSPGDIEGRAGTGGSSSVEKRSSAPSSVAQSPREAPSRSDAAGPVSPRKATGRGGEREALVAPDPQTAGGQLFVFMEAETAWRSFEPERPCEAGRYTLRIRIENGVVREVWPVANPSATTRQVRASQLVLGLDIEDVADGEYAAEVVIEPDHGPRR